MKKINNILKYIVCFLFVVVAFITVVDLTSFNRSFYKKEYTKLNVYDDIKISEDDLERVTNHLLDYIKDKNDDLTVYAVIDGSDREVFNAKEKLHMVDVKNLYLNAIIIRDISFGVLMLIIGYLFFKKDLKEFNKIFINTLKILSVFLLSIVFYALVDFENFWINFHYIFFDNELFFLNPNTDILIMMVPQQFFVDLVFRIILYFVLVLVIFGILINKMRRFKNDSHSTL